MWNKPVTDRTFADVQYAEKNKASPTANKGAFNSDDLNRIEDNCAYLSEQLNIYGYKNKIVVKTDWAITDFMYKGEIDRIRQNINTLISCYAWLQGSYEIRFWDGLDWNDVNSLEQNIKNIDILIQRMIQGFRYSGGFNFYSGNGVALP